MVELSCVVDSNAVMVDVALAAVHLYIDFSQTYSEF